MHAAAAAAASRCRQPAGTACVTHVPVLGRAWGAVGSQWLATTQLMNVLAIKAIWFVHSSEPAELLTRIDFTYVSAHTSETCRSALDLQERWSEVRVKTNRNVTATQACVSSCAAAAAAAFLRCLAEAAAVHAGGQAAHWLQPSQRRPASWRQQVLAQCSHQRHGLGQRQRCRLAAHAGRQARPRRVQHCSR